MVVGIETDTIWVQLTTTGSGSATSAVNSSCSCSRVLFRFDEVMRATVANSVIHVGRGTFETRGACLLFFQDEDTYPFDVGYLVKSGQKMRGSGMGVTTLKLVYAVDPDYPSIAVGNYSIVPSPYGYLQQFEMSDFTVDGNLPGQPVPAAIGLAPVVMLFYSACVLRRC